ncbi:hypothetical protein SKAU_G00330900 [Synaphobranchus kaupii]|uniref:LRRNT domain-containing protein n=1 Tax=Synaphobranchus kaupii TaxID=118154 RepID=A0A9Q1III4_SYNKA|nr:hypothetical protein SKAU_G00330900 [Synaphobranchus kaupii]
MLNAVQRAFVCTLFCAGSVCAACPHLCECSEAAHTVKCVSKDLREIPSGIPGYTRNLFILGNQITRIGPESFKGLENVTNLSLSNNRITEVESHTFGGLRSLRSLDLSGNQLALIHPEALAISSGPLRDLNLSRASTTTPAVADLATALRRGMLGSLRQLDLSTNGLVLLPPAMFLPPAPRCSASCWLTIPLLAVHNGTFLGLEPLEELDLTHNGFRTFRRRLWGSWTGWGGLGSSWGRTRSPACAGSRNSPPGSTARERGSPTATSWCAHSRRSCATPPCVSSGGGPWVATATRRGRGRTWRCRPPTSSWGWCLALWAWSSSSCSTSTVRALRDG